MTTDSEPAPESVTTPGKSIEIDVPPARVWQIVSEVRNAPQWSGQAHKVFATGGPTTAGTRSFNLNKQGPMYWPTMSRVVAFEPERTISNRIGGHRTTWTFELEPTPSGGTTLTERQEIPAAMRAVAGFIADKLSGSKSNRSAPTSRGPSSSLRHIKALAEQNSQSVPS